MPLEITRNDITKVKVEDIVNTTNKSLFDNERFLDFFSFFAVLGDIFSF